MLKFENLSKLSHHHHYLSELFGQEQFFFVGGMIRDLLLDRQTNMDDVDVTMAGDPIELGRKIKAKSGKDFSFFDTEKYGTMTIIPKKVENGKLKIKSGELGEIIDQGLQTKTQYEITPFRTETTYSDGRHPDEVVRSDSLLADSERRDFTINCMYYTQLVASPKSLVASGKSLETNDQRLSTKKMIDLLEKQGWFVDENSQTLIIQDHDLITQLLHGINGTLLDRISQWKKTLGLGDFITLGLLIDPHHGIQDLINKKIRCVGVADKRFQEDSLRLIRALRFAITLEFDFTKDTRTSLQKNSYLVRQVAKERSKQELDKVFADHNPFGFVALLDESNMLKWIFPKLYDNKNVNQPIRYHPFDVYTHSMMVMYHTQSLSTDLLLRYAALYHDVGKVEQFSSYAMNLDTDGLREIFSSWLNHPVCGAEFTRTDFRALGFSNKEIDTIERYVRRHMKPGEILNGDENSQRKKMRKLIAEVGPEMTKNLCILTIADRLGQYNPIQSPEIDSVYDLIALVDTLMSEEGRFTMKQLAVNGDMLIKELGLVPGPQLGVVLSEIFERVSDNIADRNDKSVILDRLRQMKKI